MNKFLNNLERKFGRFAIKNLMLYVIGIYALGVAISLINPMFYYNYLSLNMRAIFSGQLWRLVTFIIRPPISQSNLFFIIVELYFFWIVGNSLERVWGTFRFNIYYLSGILLNIIAAAILYLYTGDPTTGYYFGISYINQSLLLAFCAMYPEDMVFLMFVIPVKLKYLGVLYGGYILLNIIEIIFNGNYVFAIAILVAVLNFVWFFFATRKSRLRRRVINFERKHDTSNTTKGMPKHRCSICGRTELDNPNLEFRFCSKCAGNYEYCNEHLYTHRHIEK